MSFHGLRHVCRVAILIMALTLNTWLLPHVLHYPYSWILGPVLFILLWLRLKRMVAKVSHA